MIHLSVSKNRILPAPPAVGPLHVSQNLEKQPCLPRCAKLLIRVRTSFLSRWAVPGSALGWLAKSTEYMRDPLAHQACIGKPSHAIRGVVPSCPCDSFPQHRKATNSTFTSRHTRCDLPVGATQHTTLILYITLQPLLPNKLTAWVSMRCTMSFRYARNHSSDNKFVVVAASATMWAQDTIEWVTDEDRDRSPSRLHLFKSVLLIPEFCPHRLCRSVAEKPLIGRKARRKRKSGQIFTAGLTKTSHANSCASLTNRPLRTSHGRFVRVG